MIMGSIFYDCNSLTNLNLSDFKTKNVIDISYMFYDCNSLTNLNLANFNIQNVTDMCRMFDGCKSLKEEKIITEEENIIKQFLNDN